MNFIAVSMMFIKICGGAGALPLPHVVTARATPNIALIKYWGKRDEGLVLPYHASISMTLDGDSIQLMGEEDLKLFTTTSVVVSDRLESDEFYLNGIKMSFDDSNIRERFQVVDMLRDIAGIKDRILVVSENLFPTATGLASSASGIATLVLAVSKALGLELSERQLSIIARQGSGSACRSVMGGIVRWDRGTLDNGYDSYARQIHHPSHWPELVDVIVIVSEQMKRIPSRAGMSVTARTSELFQRRLEVVNVHLEQLEEALGKRNFPKLAEIIMKESNNMHATMLDSSPPIMYLEDVSREIMYAIHDLNSKSSEIIAGYTFDAGPNAHVITLRKHVDLIVETLKPIRGIRSVIMSGIGNGPQYLDDIDALIDRETLKLIPPLQTG